jgi:Holliday junction resolvasome RuvABC endonuclease subunit
MKSIRLLAIDPGTKYFGYADFDGALLVDYGVRTVRQGSLDIVLDHVEDAVRRLVAEKRPRAVAYEYNAFSQSTQNYRLQRAIRTIEAVAKRLRVRTFRIDPRTVRRIVAKDGNCSKSDLARIVASRHPELRYHRVGKNRSQELYLQNAIDAVAVGLAFRAMSTTLSARTQEVKRP